MKQFDRRVLQTSSVAGLAILLAACSAQASAEPSIVDIRQAMVRSIASNPDSVRLRQKIMDAEDQTAGGPSRKFADVLEVNKGPCVAATDTSGFVCDVRTMVPVECPVATDANEEAEVAAPDAVPQADPAPAPETAPVAAQASNDGAMPKFLLPSQVPVEAPVKSQPICGKDTPFGPWIKVRLFQADGQWQLTSAQ